MGGGRGKEATPVKRWGCLEVALLMQGLAVQLMRLLCLLCVRSGDKMTHHNNIRGLRAFTM